ncbi:hypothetical protein BH11PSE8_BH11PSE8_30870 [soil metagenome]
MPNSLPHGSNSEPIATPDRSAAVSDDPKSALHKLPGAVFQLLRSAAGAWTFPFASRGFENVFMTTAAGLAEDAALAARHVPPEDLQSLQQYLGQSRESGQTCKARFRVRTPSGQHSWFEVIASPEMSFSGGTIWHGLLIDVTADQRANSELRTLHQRWTLAASAAGIGVIEFDVATSRLALDAIACSHHGLAGEPLTLPLTAWLDRVVPEDRLVAHSALTSQPIDGFSERLLLRVATPEAHEQGSGPAAGTRTLEFMFQVFGAEQRLVGTCRDVTQEQSLEALRREKLAAEKANVAKTEFMSRVSHELRTPLNGILGFVQLMLLDRRQPLPASQRRRLDVVEQSGSRLMALIDQLLDISRMEEGRLTLRPEAVDVGAAVDHCVASLFPLARSRGIEMSVEVAPDAAAVLVDRAALGQVLDNLLSNAIKYNRVNGRVRIIFEAREGGMLLIDDTGIGMSDRQLAQLFEPFNRLGAERSAVRGAGLGLVITKKLLQAMGGEVQVRSRAGVGTRFEVTLPLAPAQMQRSTAAPPAASPPTPRHGDGTHLVLYIEDDEVNTLLMEQVFLTQPAWEFMAVATGAAGLAAALSRSPSLILLDMHLPDLSGGQVLERLRADPRTRGVRCIAVSADALPEQIDDALASGFDGYWTKPIDLSRVIGELQTIAAES